jgi:hypothetical protein
MPVVSLLGQLVFLLKKVRVALRVYGLGQLARQLIPGQLA